MKRRGKKTRYHFLLHEKASFKKYCWTDIYSTVVTTKKIAAIQPDAKIGNWYLFSRFLWQKGQLQGAIAPSIFLITVCNYNMWFFGFLAFLWWFFSSCSLRRYCTLQFWKLLSPRNSEKLLSDIACRFKSYKNFN